MEYFGRALCVTYEELTSGDEPIMKACTLWQATARGRIKVARRGGGEGSCALYEYASLPEKYRRRWEELYGSPEQMERRDRMLQLVPADEAARAFYEAYTYELDGEATHLKAELVAEYTANASVLTALISTLRRMELETKKKGNPRRELWPVVMELSEQWREVHPHTLPTSESRMKRRMQEFRKSGYASLISGKLGNSNTIKLIPEAQRLLIALKRSHTPVYTESELMEEFNRVAEAKGWKPVKSKTSLRNFFKRPDIEPLWMDARLGEQATRLKYDRRHRTELPTLRDALWYGDGTKLNLYYQDERGHQRTLFVYEVIDAATEVLLGYHVSETEDGWAQYHALRMAIQTAGHRPYELVTDNQGGHGKKALRQLFSKIALRHRPTAPYNGRSKTIESVFGRFQKQVLARRWQFTGMNITATSQKSRPNLEFVDANRRELPTRGELLEEYARCREEWNARPLKEGETLSRWEAYQQGENPETPAVTTWDLMDMFWLTTEKPSTFTASGIEVTLHDVKRAYEVYGDDGLPDLAWRRRNTLRRFFVQYDPCDLSSVRLLSEDGRYVATARPYLTIHRAQQDQTEGEAALIRQMNERIEAERVERLVAARHIEQEHGTAPEQNGLVSPTPLGMSKAAKEELERRAALYTIGRAKAQRSASKSTLGQHTKAQSNMDWMNVADGTYDVARTNSKL